MSLIQGNNSLDSTYKEESGHLSILQNETGGQIVGSSTSSATTGRNESLANIEITVLSIILFLAVVGNGVMLLALRRQLKYRPMSRMYFFMLNLSIADLLVAFCNILPQLAWDITFRFRGPDILCRIVKFLQVFVLYLSTYVLTSMAIDRYLVVCHHSFSRNHYGGLKGPKILVIISWIISFIFASPQFFIFSLTEISEQAGVFDCWVTFIEPWGARAYVTWFVMSVFIFPLFVIGASYGLICIKVVSFSLPSEPKNSKKNSKSRKFSLSSSSERRGETGSELVEEVPLAKASAERGKALRRQISQAKIKTLKLTLVVCLSFVVCWAPFCITQLVMVYAPAKSNEETLPVQVILLLLASLNACTNPWIYLAFSESLFNQLRVCLGFGLGRGSDEESIGDEQTPEPLKKKPQKVEQIDIAKAQQPLRRGRSSIDHDGQDDRIQPETKSDIV